MSGFSETLSHIVPSRHASSASASSSSTASPPAPAYQHLLNLTDDIGLFEHALFESPRVAHGYCVDDVARALIVGAREPHPSDALRGAITTYLTFVDEAITPDGKAHNRRTTRGRWSDEPSTGDWWGRAIWASGIAATLLPEEQQRDRVRAVAFRAMQQESPFVRSNVFAVIGAAELLRQNPDDDACRAFLERALAVIPLDQSAHWDWPEKRLTYGNGSYVEAILTAGIALDDDALVGRGLELLVFLLEQETRDGHFSVTGVGGGNPFSTRPQFDQQPIEVAAIADACMRTLDLTGDLQLLDNVVLAWAWFTGDNDSGVALYDPVTGAGFDGLEHDGRNQNRGAESTLAALSTLQHVRRLRPLLEAN